MRMELCRVSKTDKQTLGQIDVFEKGFTCYSLELPDLNSDGIEGNETRKSCIPCGTYVIRKENHLKFGWCYRVYDVPGRAGVLIHSGTYFSHTLGCILPAMEQKDLNKDGEPDNVSSRKALDKLIEFDLDELYIYDRQG